MRDVWSKSSRGLWDRCAANLRRLLPEHRIRIVKPVVLKRRVVRRSRRDGPVLSARRSPKRGSLLDVFDDLIGVVRVFPHSNLEIEVLGVAIEEVRVPRRRWPGYRVVDRCLGEIHETTSLVRGRRPVDALAGEL